MESEAMAGIAKAQYYMGLMYSFGDGVKEDLSEAAIWLDRASKQGYTDANEHLESIRKIITLEKEIEQDEADVISLIK